MFSRHLIHIFVSLSASLPLIAASQTAGSDASQAKPSASKATGQQPRRSAEPIYGSRLMTPEERAAYREKMHSAKTAEERQRMRDEHHKDMQARAKERGVTLPEQPPARSRRGQGTGMGPGGTAMGPGSMGMGPGPGGGSGPGPGPGPGAGTGGTR